MLHAEVHGVARSVFGVGWVSRNSNPIQQHTNRKKRVERAIEKAKSLILSQRAAASSYCVESSSESSFPGKVRDRVETLVSTLLPFREKIW